MEIAASAPLALGLTVSLGAAAYLFKAVTGGGFVGGILVGATASVAYGLPGLGVIGAFFVLGSGATKVGWARKSREGTAEAGGGARDARRVLGKGGVAAGVAVAAVFVTTGHEFLATAFAGAVAAALADTLGTEVGTLARGRPRLLPSLRPVPAGTPGAVSVQGTLAALVGAFAIGAVTAASGILEWRFVAPAAVAGFLGAMAESLVAGIAPAAVKAPGWVRNLLTTGLGGGLGAALAVGVA